VLATVRRHRCDRAGEGLTRLGWLDDLVDDA